MGSVSRTERPLAGEVPPPPRPVPGRALWREHLVPFATGASWLAIGAIALVVGRLEGLPPPAEADAGGAWAWFVGLVLVVAGGGLVSFALVRGTWWARLQRHGRATDARVTRVDALSWLLIGGRHPLQVELRYRDQEGSERWCWVWTHGLSLRDRYQGGDSLVVIHSPTRPDEAVLYWDR